ncbi:MAG: hypothetical protein GEU81_12980 [Nitriliruptorales bacterium]|nr:hypothetical protein [Nitriliruptorales bacterium]
MAGDSDWDTSPEHRTSGDQATSAAGESGAVPPSPPAPPSPGRPWRWIGAVGVLAAAVVAMGAGMAVNAQRAAEWREQTVLAQAEHEAASEALEEINAQLEETSAQLDEVEASRASLEEQTAEQGEEISDLEDRLRTLANEKAAVEDEREVAFQESEFFAEATQVASEVSGQLDVCIDEIVGWMGSAPGAFAADWEWEAWAADGDLVAEFCAQAQDQFIELQRMLGG